MPVIRGDRGGQVFAIDKTNYCKEGLLSCLVYAIMAVCAPIFILKTFAVFACTNKKTALFSLLFGCLGFVVKRANIMIAIACISFLGLYLKNLPKILDVMIESKKK